MVMLICEVAVTGDDSESATCTVKVEVPAAVGVPAISPAVLRLNPAGRLPETSVHV